MIRPEMWISGGSLVAPQQCAYSYDGAGRLIQQTFPVDPQWAANTSLECDYAISDKLR